MQKSFFLKSRSTKIFFLSKPKKKKYKKKMIFETGETLYTKKRYKKMNGRRFTTKKEKINIAESLETIETLQKLERLQFKLLFEPCSEIGKKELLEKVTSRIREIYKKNKNLIELINLYKS